MKAGKIPFTDGEKTAYVVSWVIFALALLFYTGECIVTFTSLHPDRGQLILLPFALFQAATSAVIFVPLSLLALRPEWVNKSGDDTSEQECRTVRRSCITGGIIIVSVVFLIRFIPFGL